VTSRHSADKRAHRAFRGAAMIEAERKRARRAARGMPMFYATARSGPWRKGSARVARRAAHLAAAARESEASMPVPPRAARGEHRVVRE